MNGSTNDNLIDCYIFGAREQTKTEFDQSNQEALTDAAASIGKILFTQTILLTKGVHFFGARFDALALCKTALDTLVSALHLARQRAHIEVACLLRAAIESAATAVHICRSPESYEAFLKGTYHSTKSIGAAKKEIPLLGQIWGALSTVAVHVNRRGHGPNCRIDEKESALVESVAFNLGVRRGEPIQDRLSLTLISLAAAIVDRALDLSLLEPDPSRPGWRTAPGTSMISLNPAKERIERRYKEFLALVDTARRSASNMRSTRSNDADSPQTAVP